LHLSVINNIGSLLESPNIILNKALPGLVTLKHYSIEE